MDKIYYEIDNETGELRQTTDRLVVLEDGDIVRRKTQIDRYNIIQHAKTEGGNFVWVLFAYGKNLFPQVSAANLTRLMYVATFCKQDGSIMNKKDLQVRMGLKKTRWFEFWKEMTENDILYEQDSMVYVNSKYVSNGKIETDQNYTRLFCQYVRQLYEGCSSTSDHKHLSYLFRIIPFINRRTNTVCLNPTEQNEDNIQAMRLGDFCEAVGYNRNQARRLAKELLKIRINGELAIGFFVSDLDEKTWMLVVNPKLYFGGKYDLLFQKYKELFLLEAQEYERLTVQN